VELFGVTLKRRAVIWLSATIVFVPGRAVSPMPVGIDPAPMMTGVTVPVAGVARAAPAIAAIASAQAPATVNHTLFLRAILMAPPSVRCTEHRVGSALNLLLLARFSPLPRRR